MMASAQRRVSPFVAPLVALLALAACNDAAGPSDTPQPVSLSQVAAARVPNTIRYAENAAHPATGRSGSASLEVRALLSRDGTTLLEVTTGSLRDTTNAPGTMTHVQVKLFSRDGNHYATDNYFPDAPYFALAIQGLERLDSVQVQANIRGIDGNRTDVVTVKVPVLLRPDLRASDLVMPAAAVAGVPIGISATITELNGDVGAETDCVLTVEGVQVDVAPGIWVDGGDAVSCAFTYTFPRSPGLKTVTVSAENVDPYDDDTSNNAVSGTIDVTVEIPNAFDWQASARDEIVASADSSFERVTGLNGVLSETWRSRRDTARAQSADFEGVTHHLVTFPLTRLELGQWTGGSAVSHVLLEGVPSTSVTGAMTCGGGDLTDGQSFSVCTTSSATPQTVVTLQRRAGRVTYQSLNYGRTWYRDDSGTPYYVENTESSGDATTTGAAIVEYGSDYRFLVRLNSQGWVYIQDATVPLTPFSSVTDEQAWQCSDVGSFGVTVTRCRSFLETTFGKAGEASGTAAAFP